MEQTYKYDAFISYRHVPLDIKIAELLHTKIETFKTPVGYKKIERVFRDRDELPTSSNLADSILDALTHSRYLIVICSPSTALSKWVLKEIEIFRELHGNGRILTILIEGEPEDVFPENLRLIPYTTTDDSGQEMTDYEVVEPLAADIRDKSFKGMKKKLNSEILRLMAPLYGCNYDDLKQRHQKRIKRKKVITAISVTISVGLIIAFGISQLKFLEVQKQQVVATEELLIKTNELLDQNEDVKTVNNDDQVVSTLTENGIYLGNGDDLWKEGLPEDAFLITDYLTADFVVSDVGNNYIISNETYDSVKIFDFNTRALLFTLLYENDDYIGATFIENTNQVVVLSDTTASLINLDTFTIEKEYKTEDANTISASKDGTYLLVVDNYNETVSLVNTLTMTVINSYPNEGYGNSAEFSEDNLYTFVLNDESLLSINTETSVSHIFSIDEYSNVAINNDEKLVAVIKQSTLMVYDYVTGQVSHQNASLPSEVVSLSFIPSRQSLIISYVDGSLEHLDLISYESQLLENKMASPINRYIYDDNKRYMVTWDTNSETAMIWDTNLMQEIAYVPYFFGITPDFKTVFAYEAFNLYGMTLKSLEEVFKELNNN